MTLKAKQTNITSTECKGLPAAKWDHMKVNNSSPPPKKKNVFNQEQRLPLTPS